jgi:transcriptional regulator with XRE-family HTH domain
MSSPQAVRVALPFCSITLTAPKPTKKPTVLKTLGDHIRKRRLELGSFQKDVAERIGVDQTTVHNWERGYTKPPIRYLPRILEFLCYDPSSSEPKTIGEKLLAYRRLRGMNQKDLARQIGIDPTTLSRIERGKDRCFPSIIQKIVEFLRGHV